MPVILLSALPTALSKVKANLKSYVDLYCNIVVNQGVRMLVVVM